VLEIMLGSHDVLLVIVICFLVIIVADGSNYDSPGVPHLPVLAILSTFLSASVGSFGWHYPATIRGHFPIA
jgi:hypothetical protein